MYAGSTLVLILGVGGKANLIHHADAMVVCSCIHKRPAQNKIKNMPLNFPTHTNQDMRPQLLDIYCNVVLLGTELTSSTSNTSTPAGILAYIYMYVIMAYIYMYVIMQQTSYCMSARATCHNIGTRPRACSLRARCQYSTYSPCTHAITSTYCRKVSSVQCCLH